MDADLGSLPTEIYSGYGKPSSPGPQTITGKPAPHPEQQSVAASERYQLDMEAMMKAQEENFGKMIRKQEEELVAVKKSQDEKTSI